MSKIYDISDLLREASTVRSRRGHIGGGLSTKTSHMLREGRQRVPTDDDDVMLEMVRDLKRIEDNRWLGVEETFDCNRWDMLVEGIDWADGRYGTLDEAGMREKDPKESGPPPGASDHLEDYNEDQTVTEDDTIGDAEGYLVPA